MTLPSARLINPSAVPALQWGVIGTGWIAGYFVDALHGHTGQRVTVVAARDAERTGVFAASHGIERVLTPPEALFDLADIDVVYIATPHASHRDLALRAIAAGKHVLVEKPFAMTAAESAEIAAASRAAGVMAMEAMWTRYLPQSDVLRQLIAAGELGEINQVVADFGSAATYDPTSRLWDPAQGGGALLDIGVYPISFASSILGTPERVQASGLVTADGVDLRATALLTSAGGAADAVVSTSLLARTPAAAMVVGSLARVNVLPAFFAPSGLRVTRGEQTEEWIDDRFSQRYDALGYQATALAAYVGEGRIESPLHPLDEVTAVLRTVEEIRDQLTVTSLPS
ncbi:Gfo/Idh/MocA family protein [Microbacterium gorillae]|uniref:Gfo/Idh/MocA family protein n=1 Tax=Microbacterium gorillae TaxID=1231063 RepID=UPI003D9987D2